MSLRQPRAYIDQTADPLFQRFNQQRHTAKQRGIPWELTFGSWLEIWKQSGHLHERGRERGEYQMARPGDVGPYASSNVRIIPMESNSREAQLTKRRIRLERQAASLYGGRTAPPGLSTIAGSSN